MAGSTRLNIYSRKTARHSAEFFCFGSSWSLLPHSTILAAFAKEQKQSAEFRKSRVREPSTALRPPNNNSFPSRKCITHCVIIKPAVASETETEITSPQKNRKKTKKNLTGFPMGGVSCTKRQNRTLAQIRKSNNSHPTMHYMHHNYVANRLDVSVDNASEK